MLEVTLWKREGEILQGGGDYKDCSLDNIASTFSQKQVDAGQKLTSLSLVLPAVF